MGCFSCFGKDRKGEEEEVVEGRREEDVVVASGAEAVSAAAPFATEASADRLSQLQLEIVQADGLKVDPNALPHVEVTVIDSSNAPPNKETTHRDIGPNPQFRQIFEFFDLATTDDITIAVTVYSQPKNSPFRQKKFRGHREFLIDPSKYLISGAVLTKDLYEKPGDAASSAFFRKHGGNLGSITIAVRTGLPKGAEAPLLVGPAYNWTERKDGTHVIPYTTLHVMVSKAEGLFDPADTTTSTPKCYVELSANGVTSDADVPQITGTAKGRSPKWSSQNFAWGLPPETEEHLMRSVTLTATVYVRSQRKIPSHVHNDPAFKVNPQTGDIAILTTTITLSAEDCRKALLCPIRTRYNLKTMHDKERSGGTPLAPSATPLPSATPQPQPIETPGMLPEQQVDGLFQHESGVNADGEGVKSAGELPPPPQHALLTPSLRAEEGPGVQDATQMPRTPGREHNASFVSHAMSSNTASGPNRVLWLVIRSSAARSDSTNDTNTFDEEAAYPHSTADSESTVIPDFPYQRPASRRDTVRSAMLPSDFRSETQSAYGMQSVPDSLDADLVFNQTTHLGGEVHLHREDVISRLDAFFASLGKSKKDCNKVLDSVEGREILLYERLRNRYREHSAELRFIKDYYEQQQRLRSTVGSTRRGGGSVASERSHQRPRFFDMANPQSVRSEVEDDARLPAEERLARALKREQQREHFVDIPEARDNVLIANVKTYPEGDPQDLYSDIFHPADEALMLPAPPPRPSSQQPSIQELRPSLKQLPGPSYEGIKDSQEDRVNALERELRYYKGTCERLMSTTQKVPPFYSASLPSPRTPALGTASGEFEMSRVSMMGVGAGGGGGGGLPRSPGLRPATRSVPASGGYTVGYHQTPHHAVTERDMHSWLLTPPRSPHAGDPLADHREPRERSLRSGGGRAASPTRVGYSVGGGGGGGGGADALLSRPISPTASMRASGWMPSSVVRSPSSRKPWR